MINNAAFFGIIFPGLGQIIQGRLVTGISLAVGVILLQLITIAVVIEGGINSVIYSRFLFILSIVLYLHSIIDAAQWKSKSDLEREELVRLQLKQLKDGSSTI